MLGATKLVAERLTTSAEYFKGPKTTKFSSVRFGNVVGSSGSVLELFKKQVSCGGPVTLTHPDMTRFIMTISQAVNLVLQSVKDMLGGEVFILKMPVMKLSDLMEVVIEEEAPKHNLLASQIAVKVIGLRAGEKMHEALMTEEESRNALETPASYIVLPDPNNPYMGFDTKSYKGAKKITERMYGSRDSILLTKCELRALLKKGGVL